MTYIKPTSDIFIKYLFGHEEHKDLLLEFINMNPSLIRFAVLSELSGGKPWERSKEEEVFTAKIREEDRKLLFFIVPTLCVLSMAHT